MFPEKGDRFIVENICHKGGSGDTSYQAIVFECILKDEKHLVAKVVKKKKGDYFYNSWCYVGKVIDFSTMTGEFITVNDEYINALNNVPGNGFGFIRTGQMPKLVLVDGKLIYAKLSKSSCVGIGIDFPLNEVYKYYNKEKISKEKKL